MIDSRLNRLGRSVYNGSADLPQSLLGSPPNLPHLLLLDHPESVAHISGEIPDGFFYRSGGDQQYGFLHGPVGKFGYAGDDAAVSSAGNKVEPVPKTLGILIFVQGAQSKIPQKHGSSHKLLLSLLCPAEDGAQFPFNVGQIFLAVPGTGQGGNPSADVFSLDFQVQK